MFDTDIELLFPNLHNTKWPICFVSPNFLLFVSSLYTMFLSDALASAIVQWDWIIVVLPDTTSAIIVSVFYTSQKSSNQKETIELAELAETTDHYGACRDNSGKGSK